MTDSGQSSAFDEYDLHLSSLTVGEFKQEIEINGRVLRWLLVKVQIGVGVRVWGFTTGDEMNEQMTLEAFINDAILAENHARRARRRRSTSPVRENGAFILQANVCTPGVDENVVKVVEDLDIEGILMRRVYGGNQQHQNVHDLKRAITEAWENIDQETIRKLCMKACKTAFFK